jgi:hypothetical protein
MSQDADTTLSGSDERNPNTGPVEWAELASRLHDELVGLLTRKPEAAADLAPAIELAARLRSEGERQWRFLALRGSSLEEVAAGGRTISEAAAGVLDEFAAIPRPRLIRQTDRFLGPVSKPLSEVSLGGGPSFREGGSAERRPRRGGVLESLRSLHAESRDPGIHDLSGRRFVVEGRSLHEYSPDADRPPISVNEADYERIARVLGRLAASPDVDESDAVTSDAESPAPPLLPGIVQAKPVREATGDARLTDPLEPRLVSLTHVYICLRCWQAAGLVRRESGGWFRPVVRRGRPGRPFHELAADLWQKLSLDAEAGED